MDMIHNLPPQQAQQFPAAPGGICSQKVLWLLKPKHLIFHRRGKGLGEGLGLVAQCTVTANVISLLLKMKNR